MMMLDRIYQALDDVAPAGSYHRGPNYKRLGTAWGLQGRVHRGPTGP